MIILNMTAEAEEGGSYEQGIQHEVVLAVGGREVWRSEPHYLRYDDPDESILDIVTTKLREVFK